MFWKTLVAVPVIFFGNPVGADTPVMRDPSRGELLYATHCIACHTADIHWRDKRLVVDRTSLRAQVRRWQAISGLGWDDDDVAQVSRYLDALHYRYSGTD